MNIKYLQNLRWYPQSINQSIIVNLFLLHEENVTDRVNELCNTFSTKFWPQFSGLVIGEQLKVIWNLHEKHLGKWSRFRVWISPPSLPPPPSLSLLHSLSLSNWWHHLDWCLMLMTPYWLLPHYQLQSYNLEYSVDLDNIKNWLLANRLSLNVTKTLNHYWW